MEKKFYAAVDLGGTKIYTVVAAENGSVLARIRLDTPAGGGVEPVMDKIALSVSEAMQQAGANSAQLAGAGVCVAGFYDWRKRILVNSPNIPGWRNLAVEDKLSAKLNVPVLVENDANAAALGEVRQGAGRGSNEAIFITVSTGIGAGLVLDGRIYRGAHGFAGEVGHMVVKPDGQLCGCGRHGCLETVSSGTAIARSANHVLQSSPNSLLRESAQRQGGQLTAADVFAAAAKGDKAAQMIIDEAIHYLGIGLVNLVNLLNPAVLIVGGGVSQAGDHFLKPLEAIIREKAVPPAAASVELRKAVLGAEAGVRGMLCLLAEQETGRR